MGILVAKRGTRGGGGGGGGGGWVKDLSESAVENILHLLSQQPGAVLIEIGPPAFLVLKSLNPMTLIPKPSSDVSLKVKVASNSRALRLFRLCTMVEKTRTLCSQVKISTML